MNTNTTGMTKTSDADLIRICAEHIANREAYNADSSGLEPKDNPLWQAYMRTFEVISDAEPQTLAGLAAKARATKEEVTLPDGTEVPEDEAIWAFDLVKDLIRLDDERHQPPGPMPSVLDLGRQIVRLSDKSSELQSEQINLKHQDLEPHQKYMRDRELQNVIDRAFDRECLLVDIALGMRARTLGDVAVMLGLAARVADLEAASEFDEEDRSLALAKITHALYTSLDVVIRETGLDLEEVVGVGTQAFIDREHADLGDGL